MTSHDILDVALKDVSVDEYGWPVDDENFDSYLRNFRIAEESAVRTADASVEEAAVDDTPTNQPRQGTLFALDECESIDAPTKNDSLQDMSVVLRDAFLEINEGASTDLVIADPERNCRYIQACWSRGLEASQKELNRWLFNARKAKKIGKIPGVIPYRVPREVMERYEFGSEVGARLLQDIVFAEESRWVSLDDILCDPKLGRRFVDLAQSLSPGFKAVDYRWAALSIRKAMNRKVAERELSCPDFVALGTAETLSSDDVPSVPGLFWLKSADISFYIGHTSNLNSRVAAMMKADIDSRLRYKGNRLLFDLEPLEYFVAPTPDLLISHRFEVKKQVVARYMPRLNITKEMDRLAA